MDYLMILVYDSSRHLSVPKMLRQEYLLLIEIIWIYTFSVATICILMQMCFLKVLVPF